MKPCAASGTVLKKMNNTFENIFLALIIFLGVFFTIRFFYGQRLKKIKEAILHLTSVSHFKRLPFNFSGTWKEMINAINELTQAIYLRLEKMTLEKNELEAVIDSMAEGVIIVGVNQQIQLISANLNEMLEMRSQQTVGKSFWEVIRNQEINDSLKQALNEKQAVRKEIAILGPQESHFSVQVSPVFSSKKNLVSVVAVFHDITKLAKFERMRSEFVANVSHELKTPLTSIKGFVETLQGGAVREEENARRFLEIIAKQTERLEHLVKNLLTLSAIESQDSPMDCRKESLVNIIKVAVEMSQGDLEKKGHQLNLNISSQLPFVYANQPQMEQVFINLLDNAIKFTPPNGKITIEVIKDGNFIRADIKDSGFGIAPEHLSRIFERFYRVDKARSTELGGTGLGLAIVKHIVSAHQGKIAVQSTLNQGTTFSIYLPVAS